MSLKPYKVSCPKCHKLHECSSPLSKIKAIINKHSVCVHQCGDCSYEWEEDHLQLMVNLALFEKSKTK